MDLITTSFQIATLAALFSCLVSQFEKYLPHVLSRTLKFGRSAVDLESTVYLFEVPKGWFTHFYFFAFTFSTLTLFGYWKYAFVIQNVYGILLNQAPCIPNSAALFASVLMWTQVSRRLYECLFISKFSKVAKMNVAIYAAGLWHYFGAIVAIFGGAECNECNLLKLFICVPLFAFAWIRQLEAHTILGNLRQGPSDKEYKIPFGGLFQYVSCPNYFSEIIIYISIAGIFGFRNSVFNWVTLWVIFNQVYSASMSHTWYHTKFGSKYPKERKALIPYIF